MSEFMKNDLGELFIAAVFESFGADIDWLERLIEIDESQDLWASDAFVPVLFSRELRWGFE
jgi:hypothetical protein